MFTAKGTAWLRGGGKVPPTENGTTQVTLTGNSERCNRTGLGECQGRGSCCQPRGEPFSLSWQGNALLVQNNSLCNWLLKQEKSLPALAGFKAPTFISLLLSLVNLHMSLTLAYF